eukprot:6213641-Amphidinium_carterae.1
MVADRPGGSGRSSTADMLTPIGFRSTDSGPQLVVSTLCFSSSKRLRQRIGHRWSSSHAESRVSAMPAAEFRAAVAQERTAAKVKTYGVGGGHKVDSGTGAETMKMRVLKREKLFMYGQRWQDIGQELMVLMDENILTRRPIRERHE